MRILYFTALVLLASCKQGVTVDFEVDPEFVCVPAETQLSWEVLGPGNPDVTISVVSAESESFLFPGFPHETSVREGTLSAAVPEGRTEFELTARIGAKTASATENVIGMGAESLPGGFVFEPSCAESGAFDGWEAVELSSYDSSISARGVTNTSDRPIIISHNGITQTLDRGVTSSAWNGTALNGIWSVSATLLNRAGRGAEMVSESCDPGVGPGGTVRPTPGDSTRTIPVGRLSAAFTFGCG